MAAAGAALRRASRDRVLTDLGDGARAVVPTSSVRTVYDPVADFFCKFSLNVRITNCVRKNAWYELAGAVALSVLLRPVAGPATEAVEGLSVIVRDGLARHLRPGVTPLLAAALTEPAGAGPGGLLD